MRFQRLTPERGSSPASVTFHPRLTVLTGLHHDDREALIGEILGALGGTRRDLRLDLLDDTGRHLSVRRAAAADGDRVVNLDNAHEVSLEFLNAGDLDLLHHLGLDVDRARRRCRVTHDDLRAMSRADTLVASLASRPQDQLWAAADRLRAAELRLEEARGPATEDAEEAALADAVERTHADHEHARRRYRTVRRRSLLVGAPAALAVGPAVVFAWLAAVPLGTVALVATSLTLRSRWRAGRAGADEREQLDAAGGHTYVGFRLGRMSARLDRSTGQGTLHAAAAERAEAAEAWASVAGGASVDAALARRERIEAAAAALARHGRLPSPGGDAGPAYPAPAELAEALMTRMADLRHVGPDGESLPMILDEPLAGVDLPSKQWLLELIARTAGAPQVVYLTGDPEVAAWARMEALAGQLEMVEPQRTAVDAG